MAKNTEKKGVEGKNVESKGVVEEQYSKWIYPLPVDDLAKTISEDGYHDLTDPSMFRRLIWPKQVEPENLDILIAGCGANQAAYYAFKNPNCQVLGIDLSEPSLAHQQYLKDKHNLTNLELKRMPVEEVPNLERHFDYIVSTGVLHHMPNPDAGLAALKKVLAPHGVISIMVYGYYMRAGVYMMQELFRLAGLSQDAESVAVVKATLNSLPETHSARHYTKHAADIHYDAGIVDTFLHRSDRAYTVPQVLDFAKKAKLTFRGWLDKSLYSPEALIPFNHPLRKRLETLSQEEQWAAMEVLTQSMGCHRFLLCHPEVDVADYQTNFEGEAWLQYVPSLRPPVKVLQLVNPQTSAPAKVQRNNWIFEVYAQESALLEAVDGKNTIESILTKYPGNLPEDQVRDIARRFFSRMAEFDHLQFKL